MYTGQSTPALQPFRSCWHFCLQLSRLKHLNPWLKVVDLLDDGHQAVVASSSEHLPVRVSPSPITTKPSPFDSFLGFLASSGILVGFNPLQHCYLTEPENWLLYKLTVHGMYNTRQQEVFKAIKILPAEELSDLLTFSFTTFRRSASSCVTDADGCKRMIIRFCHFPSNFIHWNTFLAG